MEPEKITNFDSCCSFDELKANICSQNDITESFENDDERRNFYNLSCNLQEKDHFKTSEIKQRKTLLLDERATPDGSSEMLFPPVNASTPEFASSSYAPPYLLTLQGNEDVLIHPLNKSEVVIGSDVSDFKLTAPDILGQHCIIRRDLEVLLSDENYSDIHNHWSVSLSLPDFAAKVWVNGTLINSKCFLKHEDLVSIGKYHLFLYKDPLHHTKSQYKNMQDKSSFGSNSSKDVDKNSGQIRKSISGAASSNSAQSLVSKWTIKTRFKYPLNREDDVIQLIFASFQEWKVLSTNYIFSPAHLLSHCIIHSCLNFTDQEKHKLLQKIVGTLEATIKVLYICRDLYFYSLCSKSQVL